jgi:hypothetical protein
LCRAESRLESRRPNGLATKLSDFLLQTNVSKTRRDTRPEPNRATSFVADGIAQDFSNLLLRASSVAARTPLEPSLDVIVEPTDENLRHSPMISR